MKKLLFLFAFLALTLTSARGQTNVYHPFPDSSAFWTNYWETDYNNGYSGYGIFGDTVINNLNYHKLYRHPLN